MAQKKITDLQLRDAFSATCNLPVDDAVQTYRVTGQQLLDYISAILSPAGMIIPFAGASVPSGWLLCDGSPILIANYQNLYNAILETWNTKRNQATGGNYSAPDTGYFRVPDLRGTFLRGVGTSSGYEATTLGATQDDATGLNGIGGTFASSSHVHDMTHLHQWASTDLAAAGRYRFNSASEATSGWTKDAAHYDGVPAGGFSAVSSDNFAADGGGGTLKYFWNGAQTRRWYTTAALLNFTTKKDNTGSPSSTSSPTSSDTETRPVNVGVNYLIKV